MRKPNLPAVARAAAYVILLTLCGATLAMLVVSVRTASEVRASLQDLDKRLTQLSQGTDSRVVGLSKELNDLSRALRKDIGLAGRATRGDMSRMRDRLAGRLDEMVQRVNDLAAAIPEPMAAQQPSVSQPAPAPSQSPPFSSTSASAQTSSPVRAATPAEEDLSGAAPPGLDAASLC